ncbi:PREDICTED: secretory carrier-associated membrane protein 1 [Bactrocera latifrons]|uniref:Secretory carrier-associated membrane protein n=2 Tax=Bactrocera latifrons TaxID=174628 RepID=A0A0K8W5L4_BACLA|nr:PREDICTED: secretory carrier-associated membrane protein 1 [Bactrocera latifrons]
MSGFDDPFVENPFADPAIQQATRVTTTVQNSLEEYNPFDSDDGKHKLQINSGNNAAVVQPLSQNAPPTAASTSIQITTEELQRRQEELDRKAAELDRREQQLQGNVPQLNNWPPLPDNFCVKPCFYQDFNLEIPPEFQKLVKHLYYTWMFYTMTMVLNIIGGLIILFYSGKITTFGLALFYAMLSTPASYICWFRPAYKAFRNDSSFNFMVFFFVYFFQTVLTVFQAVGLPDTGYCGFYIAISQFEGTASGIIVGLLLLCIAFCFAITAAANIMMMTKIHSIYRSTGASMAKAQQEFATEFMRNQHIQQAASSAVNTAINSQINNSRY